MSEDSGSVSRTISEILEGRVELSEATREDMAGATAEAWRKAHAMAWRITRNAETAQEIAQDALETALRKRHEFEGRGAWSTWVTGIARNLALNRIRLKGELLDEDAVMTEADPASRSVLRQLSQTERAEVLRRVFVAVLDPEEQAIAHFRYVENLSRSAIGALVRPARSDDKVRADLQRIKRTLRNALERELQELGHGSSFFRTRDDLR